jgi:hypothetical protein
MEQRGDNTAGGVMAMSTGNRNNNNQESTADQVKALKNKQAQSYARQVE